MKRTLTGLFIMIILASAFQPPGAPVIKNHASIQDEDTLIWRAANRFTSMFNLGDTAAMNRYLPDDFMLQWFHEHFLGKKSLLNAMVDPAVHSTLKHVLKKDGQTVIMYSDNHQAVSLNTGLEFLDPALMQSIKKEHGYGLCIMYFQKRNGGWWLKTVHLDLHCSLCNL